MPTWLQAYQGPPGWSRCSGARRDFRSAAATVPASLRDPSAFLTLFSPHSVPRRANPLGWVLGPPRLPLGVWPRLQVRAILQVSKLSSIPSPETELSAKILLADTT